MTIVIKEAYNVEKRRGKTARKKKSEECSKRTQKAKSLIVEIRKGKWPMKKSKVE